MGNKPKNTCMFTQLSSFFHFDVITLVEKPSWLALFFFHINTGQVK